MPHQGHTFTLGPSNNIVPNALRVVSFNVNAPNTFPSPMVLNWREDYFRSQRDLRATLICVIDMSVFSIDPLLKAYSHQR